MTTNYKINTAIHQICAPNWTWDHPVATAFGEILIWLVEGGEATLESRQGTHTVHRGDFLLMPCTPNSFYYGRHNPQRPLDVSWMHLFPTHDSRDGIHQELLHGIYFYQTLSDPSFATKLMRRILSTSGAERNSWLRALLREVAQNARGQHDTDTSANERLVALLCLQITENPARYRSLADLPQGHAYSRDHMIRLFKKHRGITPGEFIIRARIDHARQLLQLPGASVKQVALDLGYPDPYCFGKQFKARTGSAPGQFQQQALRQKLP